MAHKPATKAMGNLTLSTPATDPKMGSKSKKKAVADSWDDESSEEDEVPMSATDLHSPSVVSTTADRQGVSAPPPTPSSPANSANPPWHGQVPAMSSMLHSHGGGYVDSAAAARRPEKTDAVAKRMIASALGVKAPKATEEQKAYDRAVREAERKKKEEERELQRKREEETARAKKAMWED